MQDEKAIEQRLVKEVKKLGGLCLKWVSPSMTGVPDRIVIYKGLHLVELKDPKGKLFKRQKVVIKKFEECGVSVKVLTSKEAVDEFIKEIS